MSKGLNDKIKLRKGLKALINKKMDRNFECQINDSKTKETLFIKSYDGGKTYSLYRGCDLEVGDTTLEYIVSTICALHEENTGEVKKMYIGFWGGCADVHILTNLYAVPQGSRYVCTDFDKNLDIYESPEGVVYGVRS